MFRNLFLAAVLAALCAGVVMSAVQALRLTPLILVAETYEGEAPAAAHDQTAMPAADHDTGQWAPADGVERTTFTILATLLMAAGYALVIGAVSTLFAIPITASTALYWSAAGFIVFSLAPSFGLAPNLPGMPVADTLTRQFWWVGTAVATASALLLFVKLRTPWAIALGVALIVLPHLIGAPQAPSEPSGVPPTLSAAFASAVLVNAAIFWVVLAQAFGRLNDYFATRTANATRTASA